MEDWHSGGLISGLERSVRGQYWPPPAWVTVVGQGRCWTGMIWGVGVTGCLLKRLALSFSRTPSRLPPSRKCLMRVVGPWDKGGGTLGMGSPSHRGPPPTQYRGLLPGLQHLPVAGRGRFHLSFGRFLPGPRAQRPGMWRSDVAAAPPASRPVLSCPVVLRPVWAALNSLSAQARQPRADTSCLREQRLRAPPHGVPGPWHPNPVRVLPSLPELGTSLWERILAMSHTWSLYFRNFPHALPRFPPVRR